MENSKVLLEIRHLSKYFAGVTAVNDVSFDIKAGEVHVLIGENGAGKSTLVKMISGIYPIDRGELFLEGKKYHPENVLEAQEKGINIVHQELSMMPNRTVAQNIFNGREPIKKGLVKLVDEKKMNSDSQTLLDGLGVRVNASDITKNLSIAMQQMIELAKAVSTDNKILILDEPTSSLTAPEIKALFGIIADLKKKDVGIIYISHRMNEIFEIGDRITVMRDGGYVGTRIVKDTNIDEIINMMIGRNIDQMYTHTKRTLGKKILETKKLRGLRFRNVNIDVKEGEIVTLAGLVGAGRTEIGKAIFGFDPIEGGELFIDGKSVNTSNYDTKKAIAKGIAFLSEDRKQEGLFLDFSIAENIVPVCLDKIFKSGVVNNSVEKEIADKYVDKLKIATTDAYKLVGGLSGGNQQKVALAKWLVTQAKLFIFDEPTRGIDVGAKSEIYELMDELVNNGAAILMISSEMSEVIGISDRVYTMNEGEITGCLIRGIDEYTEDNILTYMLKKGGAKS